MWCVGWCCFGSGGVFSRWRGNRASGLFGVSKRSPNDQNRNRFLRVPRNDTNHYSRSLYHLSYARSQPPTLHPTLHIHATSITPTNSNSPPHAESNTRTLALARHTQPEIHTNKLCLQKRLHTINIPQRHQLRQLGRRHDHVLLRHTQVGPF